MQPIRSPSQLTLDISAAHFHLSRPSMDSGYASSMSSARLPADWMLSRMYENWKIADAAAQRLSADLRALEECESQLREARKRRDEKDKKSPKAKHKLSLKPLLRKRSSPAFVASAEVQPSDPDAPGCSIEELEVRLGELKSRVESTQSAADRLDSCFDELRRVLDDGRPVSWRSSHSSGSSLGYPYAESYRKARKTVGAREEAYQSSQTTTKCLRRACLAVQSAHHHYSKAMDLLDVVCSPKKSKWEAIVGDEQSRQQTYGEAAKWAEKAQICFNESLRSLQQHQDLLKRDEAEACEDLKETGLLQAVQLYNLMYGGKALAMGITQQVQIMTQKQDAVFQRLTSFAVWVQNCTKHCEAVERETRESRDAARRVLVALWVRADEDTETYSLAAPGEHSHIFHPAQSL
ncbi:hypothetical protein TRAPUB_9487 [Trametes pubescens]|uniref:Uncharacterized protein n=1 Tax=Trametes pubescens TaxID=154538 RepID=A0A1M2W269_TRAPU|nr:hypothetical protein TRAPUB_9487 [Trametes pubescens]